MTAPILTRQRVRIPLDNAATAGSKVKGSGSAPLIWKGFDVQFELACFLGSVLQDLSRLYSVTIEVKPDLASAAVITKTILASEINNTLAQADWDAGTAQHMALALTKDETNVEARTYRVIVYAVTIDDPSRNVPLGWWSMEIADFGARVAGTPPVVTGPYYTQSESDARYAPAAQLSIPAGYRIAVDLTTREIVLQEIT